MLRILGKYQNVDCPKAQTMLSSKKDFRCQIVGCSNCWLLTSIIAFVGIFRRSAHVAGIYSSIPNSPRSRQANCTIDKTNFWQPKVCKLVIQTSISIFIYLKKNSISCTGELAWESYIKCKMTSIHTCVLHWTNMQFQKLILFNWRIRQILCN